MDRSTELRPRRAGSAETTDGFGPASSAVESLAARRPGRTLLVVTHGGVIHNLEQGAGLDAGRVPNLSGRVVSVEGTRWAFEESLSLIAASTGGDPNRL